MSSVAVYSTRSRASERTGRIRENMNRSSAYILGSNANTDYSNYSSTSSIRTSTTTTRRPRDSSIGALGRPNRDSSLSRTGSLRNYARDSSMPRFKDVNLSLASAPTPLVTSIIASRHSMAMPLEGGLGSETLRYNRQNAIKEIHSSFMRGLKDTNSKINGNQDSNIEEIERRSKAYQKIINDQPTFASDEMNKRHTMRLDFFFKKKKKKKPAKLQFF